MYRPDGRGPINTDCSTSLVNRQSRHNSTEMNQLSPSAPRAAGVGENTVPSLLLVGLAADWMRCEDPALCWHTVQARQV